VVYPWAWVPFISFVMIASFVVINLIIAVICDAVAELQKDNIDEQLMQIKSTFSGQQDMTIRVLEKKVDNLTLMVQSMLADKARQND